MTRDFLELQEPRQLQGLQDPSDHKVQLGQPDLWVQPARPDRRVELAPVDPWGTQGLLDSQAPPEYRAPPDLQD